MRETGKGRGNRREKGSAVEERQNRGKLNSPFCFYTWPNKESFVTADAKRNPPEPFKKLNHK